MRLRVKDKTYELDLGRVTVFEARLLKKHTGMGVLELNRQLRNGDPDSAAGIAFLAKLRAGENPKWRDLDDLDMFSDLEILADDEDDENDDEEIDEDAGEALDPTRTGGRTRTAGSSATSPRSRSSSTSTRGKSKN